MLQLKLDQSKFFRLLNVFKDDFVWEIRDGHILGYQNEKKFAPLGAVVHSLVDIDNIGPYYEDEFFMKRVIWTPDEYEWVNFILASNGNRSSDNRVQSVRTKLLETLNLSSES